MAATDTYEETETVSPPVDLGDDRPVFVPAKHHNPYSPRRALRLATGIAGGAIGLMAHDKIEKAILDR